MLESEQKMRKQKEPSKNVETLTKRSQPEYEQ